MGVLSDGTAYLTLRGLARMCGTDHTAIIQIRNRWNADQLNPREEKIKEILGQQGLTFLQPFIPINKDGTIHHAFPDAVCMAVLEYYSFKAGANCKPQAQKNYRLLARNTFREFIYSQVGYDPRNTVPEIWKQFHDRVSLVYDSVPSGYFSVFKEIADVVVTLIRGGARIGDEFIPDISVGQHWGRYWRDNDFSAIFGERIKYQHNYPAYFPQSESNPQPSHRYPDNALGEFRRWMREVYLAEKFPTYLQSKERQGTLPPSFSEIAVAAIEARGQPKLLKD